MPRFRKKPIEIEAVQWSGGAAERGVCVGPCPTNDYLPTGLAPHLHAIHGGQSVYLEPGDWILPQPDGEHFYPCKPDIFEATYEAV